MLVLTRCHVTDINHVLTRCHVTEINYVDRGAAARAPLQLKIKRDAWGRGKGKKVGGIQKAYREGILRSGTNQ